MDTRNVDNMVTEILAGADARDCGVCGRRSLVPVRADDHVWFCFECGHEEYLGDERGAHDESNDAMTRDRWPAD
jgi:hypothetical protein